MPDRSEFIGVRLTPDEREKFEEYIDETNEANSLSRFLRIAAHRHIETEDEDQSIDTEELIEIVDSSVSPLYGRIDKIENHLMEIDSNTSNDDKIDRLARDLYSSLPVYSSPEEFPSFTEISNFEDPTDLSLVKSISTPYLWAEYFEEDLSDVRRACGRMIEYYPDVDYVEESIGAPERVPTHANVSIPKITQTRTNTVVSEHDHDTVRRYYKKEEP